MILTLQQRARQLALFLAIFLPLCVNAQKPASSEIVFMENAWPQALKQAAQQNKYIFVDAWATWCKPCKMLKSTTFKNEAVAQFYNKNFVSVAIDVEKGMGPQLAQKWGIRALPTLMVFDKEGNLITYIEGFISAADLLKFGKHALSAKGK
ncbi:MAG: DUF255 domain-containing protein [Sphingobacteriaceae bacterium]|nr:MAG: DUF255 domain-containing protein [Sphingobacteriaceae bacterium]